MRSGARRTPRRGPVTRTAFLGVAALVLSGLLACGGDDPPTPAAGITVAAASDLRPAFEELGRRFTEETGTPVTFSFGSSGLLREQIVNGAPFDVFASADEAYVDAVIEAGAGDAETKAEYGRGRLALRVAEGRPQPATVSDLAGAGYDRIAIANPDHAPYGRAALEALGSAGVRDDVAERLVYGENVSDTLRLVASGNADVGIVALSLVLAEGGPVTLVPEELHEPLRQTLVVLGTGERARPARAFATYVNGATGRQVLLRHGFALPGEALPALDG